MKQAPPDKLASLLATMDLRDPGLQPFQNRNPVAAKNAGSGDSQLTKVVDRMIIETWETMMTMDGHRNMWALNCLTYAGIGLWKPWGKTERKR